MPGFFSGATSFQIPGYQIRPGSRRELKVLVAFMQRAYREFQPSATLKHLAQTVEQYFSPETPLWFVEQTQPEISVTPAACLWLGNAVDQVTGDRHTHLFLLYVDPAHRRRGIGSALMQTAESWAQARGDHQVGLQVFQANQAALRFYQALGYQTQALWMIKPLPC